MQAIIKQLPVQCREVGKREVVYLWRRHKCCDFLSWGKIASFLGEKYNLVLTYSIKTKFCYLELNMNWN